MLTTCEAPKSAQTSLQRHVAHREGPRQARPLPWGIGEPHGDRRAPSGAGAASSRTAWREWPQNGRMNQPSSAAQPLNESLLQEIAASGGVKRYPAHAVLINEGDEGDALFIILSGRVKVYASNAAGKEVIINHHGPGEYVGEMALDGGVRSASVMTLEPTTCAVVRGAHLREFVIDHPDFALQLISNLIQRLRGLTESIKNLALEDVYSRVVAMLQRASVVQGTQRVVEQRLTQQDIAEQVGSSRELVSRIFKELRAGGYVTTEAGRIVILKTPPAAW